MNRVLATCVVLMMWVNCVSAQVAGRLTGSIVDANGNAVATATVSLSLPGGNVPVLTAMTTSDGLFNVSGLRPDSYELEVSAPGFQKYLLHGIKVDPARETVLPAILLALEAVSIRVDVIAPLQTVQTANAEVTTVITNEQVRRLPVLDRYPLALIQTQAGVNSSGGTIAINGQRTSSSNVTLDGINIQDNLIRNNSLSYTPNLITLDQISEFTLTTSNADSSMGGGASHVVFVTPSGTNEFHGKVYFQNRNNALAANTWFRNKDGIEKPSFNQNQIGGSFGGPLKKDKLYFYGNYEAYRLGTDVTANGTVLTAEGRNGIFTYQDSAGQVRKVNILQAAGVSADPAMAQLLNAVPGPDKINNFRVGDSRESLLRNTAGYSFDRRGHHNRDNVTLKSDYTFSTGNTLSGSFLWNRQEVTRSDQSNDFSDFPKVRNDDRRKFVSFAWRWNPTRNVTNEMRGGFNLAPLTFKTSEKFGDRIITGTIYSNPVNLFRNEGRSTNTYSLADNISFTGRKHSIQAGFQTQQMRVEPTSDFGVTPTYALGIGFGNPGLTTALLPGVSPNDLAVANSMLATLAGYITSYSQTFNVTSRTSGFASVPFVRHYRLNDYAFYIQDAWKLNSKLSLSIGLRYELPGVVDERDSLALLPRIQNNDPVATLLSNATLEFAGSSAGRPWYNRDRNNLAPNLGLAWNVFGDGKTSLRAAYGMSYVNDETIQSVVTNVSNEGLSATSSRGNLTARLSLGLPSIPVPSIQVPRTFQDNFQANSLTAFGLPDPNLRTPYVQQWNVGIQREIDRSTIFEIRYVGNHSTKLFRSFDVNPEVILENGFLDDFKRAQRNGNLSLAATGFFDPTFNAGIPGSQQLTVFPTLVLGGLLSNPIVASTIQSGQAGELAFLYFYNGLAGPVPFYRSPYSLGSLLLNNYSNASYNALQLDLVRRFRDRLQFQANYTYGKVLSDSDGTSQYRFEEFRDPRNRRIDRSRTSFDITHAIKGNAVYDLPIEKGTGLLNGLLSGWTVSGIVTSQSGNPFSILSRRGTLTRAFRSGQNTAVSALNKGQLDDLLVFRMTENGPYIVEASAIGGDGRAVSPDGTAPFSGQVFSNPGPGDVGGLQRRWFSGPWNFNLDLALLKNVTLHERQTLEMRLETLNIFNHPNWFVPDQDINAVNFGRITATSNDSRRIQLSLHYRF